MALPLHPHCDSPQGKHPATLTALLKPTPTIGTCHSHCPMLTRPRDCRPCCPPVPQACLSHVSVPCVSVCLCNFDALGYQHRHQAHAHALCCGCVYLCMSAHKHTHTSTHTSDTQRRKHVCTRARTRAHTHTHQSSIFGAVAQPPRTPCHHRAPVPTTRVKNLSLQILLGKAFAEPTPLQLKESPLPLSHIHLLLEHLCVNARKHRRV